MDVLEAAKALEAQGHDIIHFSLGEPDFDPPKVVQQAVINAVLDQDTKYTHSQGLPELREAICRHYKKKYKVHVDMDQVIVTQGTSPAFFLIFSTIIEEGDGVILPNPHYPCDANFVQFFGGHVQELPLSEENGFQWSLKDLEKCITDQTRAIFLTSPSNPTGTVLKKEVLEGIAALKIPVVSDEIYHGLVYEGHEHSFLEFSEDCFVINGFSKAYAMTGFRLGYTIIPRSMIAPMKKVQQNFHIAANTFVQRAGIAALEHAQEDLITMRKAFKERRDVLYEGLKKLGFPLVYRPEGAFYLFVKATHLNPDTYELAFDILEKAHVAVTPGIDFGSLGKEYIRFSYAVSVEKIREGLDRLEKYLKVYHGR